MTSAAAIYRSLTGGEPPHALVLDQPESLMLQSLIDHYNQAQEQISRIRVQLRAIAHRTPPGQTPPCETGSRVSGLDVLDLVFDPADGQWWALAAPPGRMAQWAPWEDVVNSRDSVQGLAP